VLFFLNSVFLNTYAILYVVVKVLFSPVRKHWLTVYGAPKCVYVLDSMAGTMSEDTKTAVRTMSGQGTRVLCSKTCTQQTNGDDCGCFARDNCCSWRYVIVLNKICNADVQSICLFSLFGSHEPHVTK